MRTHAAQILCAGLAAAFAGFASAQAAAPAAAPPSFAAPNLTEKGVRALAANCAMCHGTEGRPAPGSSVPGLAGRLDIADALRMFKDGKREATIMHQIAKGYGEAEIAALAAHFAKQPQ
jgi:cytochrome subunit of sulfide dehydrogenase